MAYVLWAALGALLGALLQQSLSAVVVGIAFGLLWARVSALASALDAVRKHAARAEAVPPPVPVAAPGAPLAAQSPQPTVAATPHASIPPATAPAAPVAEFRLDTLTAPLSTPPKPQAPPSPHIDNAPPAATPRASDDLAQRAWNWLTSGNLPVKVGVLILFAGVAALLKYTADTWLAAIPLGARIGAIALAAIVALGFGWRQREQRRVFALAVQGGALGILLLAVFAAFRVYALLPPALAFALLIVVVGAAGLLALWQDAVALAVLSLIAGFAAPILVSSGHGSHVVLFGYYAVLNVAILALAWRRSWRWLNLLGFIATFGIGTAWGVLRYRPEFFASTEPFLILNFLFYLAIPWLYARQSTRKNNAVLDGCLLFGNPLASLLLQGSLLAWSATPLALTTAVAAVIYAFAASALGGRARTGVLGNAWAVLASVFATLTVPLALGARLTSVTFALEGAGLVWLGWRQQRRLSRWAGLALQALAAWYLTSAPGAAGAANAAALLDPNFIGAVVLAVAGFGIAWLYYHYNERSPPAIAVSLAAWFWALVWWLGAAGVESLRVFDGRTAVAAVWIVLTGTAWLATEAARRGSGSVLGATLAWSAVGLWTLTLPVVLICAVASWQPLSGGLLLATAVTAAAGWRTLACLRGHRFAATAAHTLWWWRWALVAGVAILVALEHSRLSTAWRAMLVIAPTLGLWFIALRRPAWLAAPLADRFSATRAWLTHSLTALLAWVFVVGLFVAGDAAPLHFLPIFNPVELLLIVILAGMAYWLRDGATPALLHAARALLLGAGCFALATSMALRGIHQLAGVPWDASLAASALAQLALTLVWSLFGLAAWLWGSRHRERAVWWAGAGIMAVVLLKLLLVDRGHLGNLFGIASFIAYGLLCTLIGYLAPAPPRRNPTG